MSIRCCELNIKISQTRNEARAQVIMSSQNIDINLWVNDVYTMEKT
jgi:hypothetical protein